jgi:hypothetical protein
MARRRNLDDWAIALNANNDDAAIGRLATLTQATRMLHEEFSDVCDRLRGVDERGLAARVTNHLDEVQDGLFWVKRDFLLHERGL